MEQRYRMGPAARPVAFIWTRFFHSPRGEAKHCKLHHAFGPIWREGMRSMGEKPHVFF